MSNTTGDIITRVITTHVPDPDNPPGEPLVCSFCGAQPLDGMPEHQSRMIQHAIATNGVGKLSDIRLRILGDGFNMEELKGLALQGVDAFDLLRAVVAQDIEENERAACNGTVEPLRHLRRVRA